ncbi:MAG: HD domain-containing protein [Candidatus Woesearchaeota archaeon]
MSKDDFLTEKEAIDLLKKHSKGDEKAFTLVYEHSRAVKELALKTCKNLKPEIKIDIHLIEIGSILHDIGRFDCPPGKESIKHGITGSKILLKENLPKCANIAERHTGIGITKQDIILQKLPLPVKDYVPETNEEKIICYADNRIKGTEVMDENYVVERFSEEIGPEYGERTKNFHEEIRKMMKQ